MDEKERELVDAVGCWMSPGQAAAFWELMEEVFKRRSGGGGGTVVHAELGVSGGGAPAQTTKLVPLGERK